MVEFEPYIARNRHAGPHTYDLWITDALAEAWYGGDDHGIPEVLWCLAHIREGMRVADCGAHQGIWTITFSRAVGPQGRVTAWEATPTNAVVARKNLMLNGCTNATVRTLALGEERKRLFLSLSGEGDNACYNETNCAAAQVEVDCVRLDDEILPGGGLDFIKIDVDGSELHVMRGAKNVLLSSRPILVLEIHNFLYADRHKMLAELFALLQPIRYTYSILSEPLGAVRDTGENINLSEIANYHNPHVFCRPMS